tara:strand:+ start:3054 stop:4841 length:1788 start_codon:yes stop_codon:yes gene_type:complete
MSFFVASDKIPIAQKSISIPAANGVNYNANQEIVLHINDNIKFFQPEQTYLEAKVKIKPPSYGTGLTDAHPTRLNLDAETGFQSLIRTIRVHSRQGVLLEEIDNYNTMVAFKYDYETNDSLKNKRALTEGCGVENPFSRGTFGSSRSVGNEILQNQYFKNASNAPDVALISASVTADNFVDCKVCIPLHTGIFSNKSVFPNMAVGGVTISILLEDNRYCFRQVDGVNRFRKTTLNPLVSGRLNAAGAANAVVSASFNTLFEEKQNNQTLVASHCPFVVGERVGIEFERLASGGFTSASVMRFTNASGGAPTIRQISFSATNGMVLSMKSASVAITGSGIDASASTGFLYSRSIEDASSYDATYTVSDVNLIVNEVSAGQSYEASMMRKMKEGGMINYDFNSVTCYKSSLLSSDRVANIRIPIENSRCKSIICSMLDSTPYTTKQVLEAKDTYVIQDVRNDFDYNLHSTRCNLEGISDSLTEYQFLYDGRLQPSRRVPCGKISSKTSIEAQPLIELDKALSQAGITGHSMMKFNENFLIGRALALGDSSYDARNKDFVLQLNYNETTAPTKNKLVCMFVFHIRRLEIGADSVRVVV